jgi:hypothetical protein
MNGHFDTEYPDKVVHKGENINFFDDLRSIALAPNTQKICFKFLDRPYRS